MAIELGMTPGEAARLPLKQIMLLAGRIRQRERARQVIEDARFLGICTAIYGAQAGGKFDPEAFYFSLREARDGTRDDQMIEERLTAWARAMQSRQAEHNERMP